MVPFLLKFILKLQTPESITLYIPRKTCEEGKVEKMGIQLAVTNRGLRSIPSHDPDVTACTKQNAVKQQLIVI